MYFIAPRVPRWSSGCGNSTLLRLARSNASEDTNSLQKALDAAPVNISQIDIWHLRRTIVTARLIVFDAFLNLSPVYQAYQSTQTRLQLQNNCSPLSDPFDLVWRFVRLDPGTSEAYDQAHTPRFGHGLICCIDEVQVTLENRIRALSMEEIRSKLWAQFPSKTFLSSAAPRLPDLKKMIDQWTDLYGLVHVQGGQIGWTCGPPII